MEKEFIKYTEAIALKELGFDEPCFGYYKYEELIIEGKYKNSDHGFSISAPTYSQAFRFFREKYKLDGIAFWNYTGYMWNIIDIEKSNKITNITIQDDDMEEYVTKEKSELECLKKLIKIVKEK